MAEFYSALSAFISHSSVYFVSSLVCGVVIIVFLVRKSITRKPLAVESGCTSPSCVRCHGEEEIRRKLLRRLREHLMENCGVRPQDVSTRLSQSCERLLSTIDSHDRKAELLSLIYSESGHGEVSTRHLAHVWMMPGLRRAPLWGPSDHAVLEGLFPIFEERGIFEKVLQEYREVSRIEDAWKENQLPTGNWKTCFLMNQGNWIRETCEKCPHTLRLLGACGSLMESTVFGNALFSVLRPGSRIEPHTSPSNFRLRCHLALNASRGFRLRVGKLTTSWETRRMLVFDDSFVHSVWHDAESWSSADDDRVVLIFDIWHPDISQSEQQALKYMFE